MISVSKFIVLVLGLAVGAKSTHGQYLNADGELFQIDADRLRPAHEAYSNGPAYQAGVSYYPHYQSADGGLIGSLADELLAARPQQPSSVYEQAVLDLVEPELGRQNQAGAYDDAAAILDELRNQKRQNGNNANEYYDINSHLSPSGAADDDSDDAPAGRDSITGPVNDPAEFEASLGRLTDALNHNMANTIGRQELLVALLNRSSELDNGNSIQQPINSLSAISEREMDHLVHELGKLLNENASGLAQEQQQKQQQQDEDDKVGSTTDYAMGSLTRYGGSEYIDHPLALAGHQYVQGGAGEGRQLLGPDGTYENVQVIKTDSAIPSYCDPPNPCPIGYTAKDGCLENFINSASFSREYQARQKCPCDNEHSLFNCAAPMSQADEAAATAASTTQQQQTPAANGESSSAGSFDLGSKLQTLARTIQNRFGDLASVQRLVGRQEEQKNQEASSSAQLLSGNDDADPNYLVRSARKLSALDMHHKVDLD